MYVRENSDVDEKKLTFAVSGQLWNRSLVMIDSETQSLWSHLLGKAMEGELEGTMLETVPSTMVDWKTWRTDHPDTTVLALSRTADEFRKEFHQNYQRFVLGLRTLEEAKSYGFDALQREAVINDDFAGDPVLLVFRPAAAGGRAFIRKANDRTLQFSTDDNGQTLTDAETGSTWNPETGVCISGAMKDAKLEEIPAIVSFRRAWDAFYPDSAAYRN